MKLSRLTDTAAVLAASAVGATPAWAGVAPAPTPLVGAGIGAIVVMGAGYRLLKRKLDR